MLPPPGTLLASKYRLERHLGEGAMGIVVAARHIDLHELRALKLMRPGLLADADSVERFLREARAAVRLKSRHIAQVLDVGRLDDGTPYIVMEHLEGADLRAVLEARGTLSVQEAVSYLAQACSALAEAHAMGIVHRDLKPANLFVTTDAQGAPLLKVLDFGIAKVTPQPGAPGAVEMTATTDIIGTPVFMSPEQMRSTRDVDARADVWAAGVILYRALTGVLPFKGSTITQVCAAVVADDPPAPTSIRPDIPPDLERIILRCLEKSPANRFADAAELGAALAPFSRTASPAIGASPPEWGAPTPFGSAGGQTTGRASAWSQQGLSPPAPSPRILLLAGGMAAIAVVLGAFLIARSLQPSPSTTATATAAQTTTATAPTEPAPPAMTATLVLPTEVAPAPPPVSAEPTSAPSASPAPTAKPHKPPPPRPPRKPIKKKDAWGDERK